MNRYPIVLMFISLYAYNTFPVISEYTKIGEELKEQIGSKKNTTIVDKSAVMRDFRDEFDRLVKPDSLNLQQRNNAFEIQCKCSNEMIDRLGRLFYVDKQTILDDAHKQRALCLAGIARVKAAHYYETNYIIEKKLKYDKALAQKIEQEVFEETLKKCQQKIPGSLSNLFNREFEKELEKKINALLPKEIYEVYPHEKGPGYPETINNISNGRHHRLDDCCVCGDPFKEIGKRVNLPCGHDICPNCLYKNKYEWNRHTCPQCRRDINNADFPADYLKKQKDK